MKLVNVYALRKEIAECGAQLAGCYSAGIARYMNKMLDYIIAEVDRAPSVNAVVVVRCKDCRNWSEMQNSTGACLRHSVIDGSWWTGTDSTDYCSFAERRE